MKDFSIVTRCLHGISETLIDEWLGMCKKSILWNEKTSDKWCRKYFKNADFKGVNYGTFCYLLEWITQQRMLNSKLRKILLRRIICTRTPILPSQLALTGSSKLYMLWKSSGSRLSDCRLRSNKPFEFF